jgi:ATP-binding cassette, subfamily D (ALD), peroxisomal long-chain fatty acid import protein
MYAYKDLLELAGLTTRVYTLLSTLHALPPIKDFVVSDHVALDGVGVSVPERKVRGANMFEAEDSNSRNHGLGGSLMEPLKVVISRGDHLMITGPVGVGCSCMHLVEIG